MSRQSICILTLLTFGLRKEKCLDLLSSSKGLFWIILGCLRTIVIVYTKLSTAGLPISKYQGPKDSHLPTNHKTAQQSSTNQLPDVEKIVLGISVQI